MVSAHYFAFLPLFIYGIALADILSQWKRFFNFRQIFLPYLLLTIILTETAIYSVFVYSKLVNQLPEQNYLTYLMYLIPPFLFMLTANTFTPDRDSDTKEYFLKQMPVFMTLASLFIASHFLYEFGEVPVLNIMRVIVIVIVLLVGIFKKLWIFYLFCCMWLVSLFFKAGMMVI